MSLTLTIPGLPPCNAANSRGSHWAWAKLKRKWEGHVCAAVLTELGRWPDAPLERAHVTITRCSQSEPDPDNLVHGAKFLLDGLVKAGVIADDSRRVIGQPVFAWEQAPPGKGFVRIYVEDAAALEAAG